MDRLNAPTKMDQNYGRSFLQLPFHWPHITALASATGGKTPYSRGRSPREEGAKPPDSLEQGAKPPVRWKIEKHGQRKTFSK